MGKKRAVVDTNVIVSGILGCSYSQKIINAWLKNEIEVVTSNELKEEVNMVFKRPYITKGLREETKKTIRGILGTLFNKADNIVPKSIDKVEFSDKKDHFLLELAIAVQPAVIITGDRAILKLKRVKSVELVSPKQFCTYFKIK
ncbi:MAG: putative toxin-antitoxin system toxin component, PIN family [Deltaproteobacteria bacterium RIFCSPHIGHO2_12_FULL_43_9]|nr:MAG: putative toxin-antitoxin system toxin component, PIN family [Deltaproteobacteria bacterium RIFCSPHIGHO2_12_FULL_43_9]